MKFDKLVEAYMQVVNKAKKSKTLKIGDFVKTTEPIFKGALAKFGIIVKVSKDVGNGVSYGLITADGSGPSLWYHANNVTYITSKLYNPKYDPREFSLGYEETPEEEEAKNYYVQAMKSYIKMHNLRN